MPTHKIRDYCLLDAVDVDKYNQRCKPEHQLHVEMGPAPFDGDPDTAKIVLLMNNPMYKPGISIRAHHDLQFEGWPLAGLHPDAPKDFREWYNRPLGYLMKHIAEDQLVSQRVAIVQRNPWASEKFDPNCKLNSLNWQVEIAERAVSRGALVVIGRSVPFWTSKLGKSQNVYIVRSVRSARISPKNLGMGNDEFRACFKPCFLNSG